MSTTIKPPESPLDESAAPTSRRRLLAGITSLTAAAAWLPALAAAADGPDRELIAVGLEYDRADAALDAVYAEHDRRCEAYDLREPKPREAMRHRVNDLSLNLPIGPSTHSLASDFYTADEIELLRRPVPWPWRTEDVDKQRKRIAEITAEFDRWTAECAALRAAVGLDASDAAVEAAQAGCRSLGWRIAGMQAQTLAGLQVRVRIIARICDGDLTGENDGDSTDYVMLWSIVRDLAVMERPSA